MTYVLTEEGKKYLREGLPERHLIDLLKDRSGIPMKEANTRLGQDFSIALQWCKKYECIEVSGGKIILTNDNVKEINDQEKVLHEIAHSKEVPEDLLNVL